MIQITAFQAMTLAIAVLGATLGLINTWHTLDKNRVKLKVVPKKAIPYGVADPMLTFCIEVTNLSSFPLTLEEVGVFFYRTDNRAAVINPMLPDNGPWPRRLEPRSSISIYSQLPEFREGRKMRCAYARTQCGHIAEGVSPAFKQISRSQAT